MAATSEAAWNDLYNGIVELLGAERAETLMTHLLRDDHRLATESQVVHLELVVAELKADVKALNRNLVTGLIVILATMVGVLFTAI